MTKVLCKSLWMQCKSPICLTTGILLRISPPEAEDWWELTTEIKERSSCQWNASWKSTKWSRNKRESALVTSRRQFQTLRCQLYFKARRQSNSGVIVSQNANWWASKCLTGCRNIALCGGESLLFVTPLPVATKHVWFCAYFALEIFFFFFFLTGKHFGQETNSVETIQRISSITGN